MSTDAPPSILRPLVEDLHERRAKAKLGGGEEKIAKQHAADKLTARERLELLVDPGSFTELGLHAGIHYSVRALEGKEAPADGVITGYGKVGGRLVAVENCDEGDSCCQRGEPRDLHRRYHSSPAQSHAQWGTLARDRVS